MGTQNEWDMLLNTPGQYSMVLAVQLLEKLVNEGYRFLDASWRFKDYGNLIETGIEIEHENTVFKIMCSYEEIFIQRVSGNKKTYLKIYENLHTLVISLIL